MRKITLSALSLIADGLELEMVRFVIKSGMLSYQNKMDAHLIQGHPQNDIDTNYPLA